MNIFEVTDDIGNVAEGDKKVSPMIETWASPSLIRNELEACPFYIALIT